jgi:hypothetical protein
MFVIGLDLGCCVGDCYDPRVRSRTDMLNDVIWVTMHHLRREKSRADEFAHA